MSHNLSQAEQADAGNPPTPKADGRALRVLVASSMLSKVADWQLGLVIPLAILQQTDSAAMSLFSIALRGVAYAASPFLGSLIDRFDKRSVLVLSQIQQAVCLALIAVTLSHSLPVFVLLLLSGGGGVASTITGQFVLIPTLVDKEGRPAAAAKLSSAIEFSKVIGLLIGGVAFSARGPLFASLGIAVLYLGSGLVALLLPKVPSEQRKAVLRHDLAVGFQWLLKPELLWLVVTMSIVNLAIGELETALIPNFTHEGLGPRAISGLLALGLLLGAVSSRFVSSFLPAWRTESRILVLQITGFPALALIATPFLLCRVLGYMVVCLAVGASNVVSITYRQNAIPVHLAGRVNSTIRMFITGATTLSGFVYAAASHLSGYRFWLPGLIMWAAAIGMWSWYTRHSGQAPGTQT